MPDEFGCTTCVKGYFLPATKQCLTFCPTGFSESGIECSDPDDGSSFILHLLFNSFGPVSADLNYGYEA